MKIKTLPIPVLKNLLSAGSDHGKQHLYAVTKQQQVLNALKTEHQLKKDEARKLYIFK